jgi:hypothetical protein
LGGGKFKVDLALNLAGLVAESAIVKYNLSIACCAVGKTSHLAPFSRTGKMPVPARKFTLCGTGILPVHKKLIENGATSQKNATN